MQGACDKMLLIECGLVLVAVLVAFLRPTTGSRYFEFAERAFADLARRRRLAVIVVAVAALAIRAALIPVLPVPEPIVHDESGVSCFYVHTRSCDQPSASNVGTL
jgi:hypothetical protein